MCDVRLLDLPTTVKGFIVERDGYRTIVLNARLNHEQNLDTFKHEDGHDKHDDFEKTNVDQIEREAHNRED